MLSTLNQPQKAALQTKTEELSGSEIVLRALIAEGVETAKQRDLLAGLGCHGFQGFFFSKPLPPDAFVAFATQASLATQVACAKQESLPE